MSDIESGLEEYIRKWSSVDGIKPCNEQDFYELFTELLKSDLDDRDFEFDGDGSYFGKQVSLNVGSAYSWCFRNTLSFEIAYSNDRIKVYTGNHDGFWTPEYIDMDTSDERFNYLKAVLFTKLREVFGLI